MTRSENDGWKWTRTGRHVNVGSYPEIREAFVSDLFDSKSLFLDGAKFLHANGAMAGRQVADEIQNFLPDFGLPPFRIIAGSDGSYRLLPLSELRMANGSEVAIEEFSGIRTLGRIRPGQENRACEKSRC